MNPADSNRSGLSKYYLTQCETVEPLPAEYVQMNRGKAKENSQISPLQTNSFIGKTSRKARGNSATNGSDKITRNF